MSAEELLGGVPSKSLKVPFSIFLTLRTFSWAGTGVLSTEFPGNLSFKFPSLLLLLNTHTLDT